MGIAAASARSPIHCIWNKIGLEGSTSTSKAYLVVLVVCYSILLVRDTTCFLGVALILAMGDV